jgi:hypothetical protein
MPSENLPSAHAYRVCFRYMQCHAITHPAAAQNMHPGIRRVFMQSTDYQCESNGETISTLIAEPPNVFPSSHTRLLNWRYCAHLSHFINRAMRVSEGPVMCRKSGWYLKSEAGGSSPSLGFSYPALKAETYMPIGKALSPLNLHLNQINYSPNLFL